MCTKCDERCRSCEDQGEKGDKARCLACSTKYPFLYAPAQTCLEECVSFEHDDGAGGKTTKGLYMVNSQSCGVCDSSCRACYGDKFNCTKCDAGQQKALFQQELIVGGRPTLQGTCAKQCPNTHFLDKDTTVVPEEWTCRRCNSPCAACEGTADTCLACDGTR